MLLIYIQAMDLKHSVRSYDSKHQVRQSLSGKPTYYRLSLYSADLVSGNKNEAVFNTDRLLPNHREELMNGEWEVFVEHFCQNSLVAFNLGAGALNTQRYNHFGVRICLPEVCSSQNYHTELRDNAGTVALQRDDAVGFVSRNWTIGVDRTIDQTAPSDAAYVQIFDGVPAAIGSQRSRIQPANGIPNEDRAPIKEDYRVQPLPLSYSRNITVHDVGTKVNPRALLSGHLTVALRICTGRVPFAAAAGANNDNAGGPLHPNVSGFADGENWFLTLLFVHKP